jgi:hypothetical protein
MSFTVGWLPNALDRLANIWLQPLTATRSQRQRTVSICGCSATR